MPTLTPDRAQHLKDLATRLFARSRGMKDPYTGNLQGAPAIAGMLKEAAGVLRESGYSDIANRVSGQADQVFGSWQKGESYGQYRGALNAITSTLLSAGAVPNQYGWMTGDMRVSMDGAAPNELPGGVRNPGTGNVRGTLPTFPVIPRYTGGGALPGATRGTSGTRTPIPVGPPQVIVDSIGDMMDPITGVEDPLQDIRFSSSGDDRNWFQRQRDRVVGAYNFVDDNIINLPGAGPGAGSPQGGTGVPPTLGMPPPTGINYPSSTDLQSYYAQGQAFRDALVGGNGNGGDGTNLPLPFPLPQLGGLYDYAFGGNGQMPDVGSLMLPAVTAPAATARLKAPKGYVIVSIQQNDPLYATAAQAGGVQQPDGSIKVAMDKDKARKRKYWKPRPKPWLTAADRRVLTKANRVERKVAKAYLKAGIGPKDIKEAKNC